MADTEEPQFSTLKERIAALNQQKAFVGNGNGQPTKRPPPPPPPSKALVAKSASPALPARPAPRNAPPLPRRDTQTSLNGTDQNGRPPLPSRTPSAQQTTPQLPRRPSAQSNMTLTVRRNSASSERSVSSGVSSLSLGRTASSVTSQSSNGTARYNLPPVVGMADLPKLPPSRRERELQAQQEAEREAKKAEESRKAIEARRAQTATAERPTVTRVATQPIVAKSTQPPTLPSRPTRSKTEAPVLPTRPETTGARRLPPTVQKSGNKIRGFGDGREEKSPPLPTSSRNSEPPPVPVSSRPTLAAIDAAKARASAPPPAADPNDCLACRDWSEPDRVGAMYPRESLPRNDPAGFLAQNLCAQFPSYTDKARAIFTWCHHNIAYDAYSFLNNCVKHMSPTDSILSGLAVCQGYAESYKAIAEKAGLECIVIGGHGKGYGYSPLKPGEPVPPQETGHAWNAVRIDGGKWKVIDACWGAGAIGGDRQYHKGFSPHEFTRTNEEMGESHFPQKPTEQFREDGRVITWEEYFRGRSNGLAGPLLYSTFDTSDFSRSLVEPADGNISVYSGEVVRFAFTRKCKHWSQIHKAQDQPIYLVIAGRDGRKEARVPMETDGYWYWVDVNAIDLGAPGQSVSLNLATTLHGEDTHGMSQKEFKAKMNGIYGLGGSGLAKWELVR